jgi:hypothetical protein
MPGGALPTGGGRRPIAHGAAGDRLAGCRGILVGLVIAGTLYAAVALAILLWP